MKFKIEQIAICLGGTPETSVAFDLLNDLGATEWSFDTVLAQGEVFGRKAGNAAKLAFNYDICSGKEFEVLQYVAGTNWVEHGPHVGQGPPRVSHFGMHVTAEELDQWRAFFAERGIAVAQEVFTESHSNPVIAGKRWYNYVIFDTVNLLGTDLKFIVRRDHPPV